MQEYACTGRQIHQGSTTTGPCHNVLASHHGDQPYIQPHARNGAVVTGRCRMPIQMLAGDCGPVTVPRHCPVLPDQHIQGSMRNTRMLPASPRKQCWPSYAVSIPACLAWQFGASGMLQHSRTPQKVGSSKQPCQQHSPVSTLAHHTHIRTPNTGRTASACV